MSEEGGEQLPNSDERFSKMRKIVRQGKAEGLSRRDRREKVIGSVASESLDDEPVEVQEAAINKYFEGRVGSSEVHGMVDAVHAHEPGEGETIAILRAHFPQGESGQPTHEQLTQAYRRWREAWDRGEKLHKGDPDDPNYSYSKAIANIRDEFDVSTAEVVRDAATHSEGSWWIAKKSQMWADANRKSFFHKPRGAQAEGKLIEQQEFPTAARAALFWLVRKTVEGTVGLDSEGKLKKPFLRLAVHGMADRRHADIVLGGGSLNLPEEQRPASETVLRWFAQTLTKKLSERSGLERAPIVAIHRFKQEEAEVFTQDQEGVVLSSMAEKDGASLSGSGVGLEHFRGGHTFEVTDADGKERELVFPGFGEDFHTIQAEISNSLRTDPNSQRALGEMFSELMQEFSEKFAELGSSTVSHKA